MVGVLPSAAQICKRETRRLECLQTLSCTTKFNLLPAAARHRHLERTLTRCTRRKDLHNLLEPRAHSAVYGDIFLFGSGFNGHTGVDSAAQPLPD